MSILRMGNNLLSTQHSKAYTPSSDIKKMKKHRHSLCYQILMALVLLPLLGFSQSNIIQGRILDKTSGEAIEYASITIHNPLDSSLINGVVTDINGAFEFKNIEAASVYLIAQFLGYEAYSSDVFQINKNVDLGDIILSINAANLSEVEIAGKAITSVHQLDRQVYDAGQFQNARGGSARDVLGNLPSISINSFGEISVRGATGFLVMINGKPVQSEPAVVLNQLAANSIEDIEIITAPSAKYDPDGNAGIINILTKQSIVDGLYFSSNVLLGLPSIEDYDNANNTPRYGADITLNYKKGKWDLSGALDYRRYDISGRREGYVNTYIDNVLTEFPSNGERSFDEENYSARFSAIFSPTKNQSITTSFYAGKRTKERTADILYLNQQRQLIPSDEFLDTETYFDLYNQSNEVFSGGNLINTLTYFNENLRVRKGDFLIGSLDYSIQFRDESKLSLSGLYERTNLGGPTDNANLEWPNTSIIRQLQFNTNDNPLDGIRFQVDFAKQLGKINWESGYQYRFLNHPGDFDYFDRDLDNNTWIENPLFTNRIDLTREIHSIYSQISGSGGRFKYSGGLRLEYFDRKVEIERPDETFLLDQFNVFPSFNLSYDLGQDWLIKGGYSRRIERTTTFKMTPFPEREHSETLEQGDAELLPEYIDVVELGFVKSWEDNSLFANVYYRNIDNVINRVNTIFNDTILNRIYTNVGQAEAIGMELGLTAYPSNWWRLYIGGNIFSYNIEGALFGDQINTSNTVYSINMTSNFSFSSSFTLQLALNYLSERITAQGQDSRFYNPSLSLNKSFLDKKLNLSLQWRNIDLGLLASNEQRITTVRNNFYTTTNYVYEVDILQLSISYRLNQIAKKLKFLDSEFGRREF